MLAHVVTNEVFEAVWPPPPPPLIPPAAEAPILTRTLVEAAEALPLRFNSSPPFSLVTSRPLLRERSKVMPDCEPVGADLARLCRGRSEAELEETGATLEFEQVLERDALRLRGVKWPVSAGPTFLISPALGIGGRRRLSELLLPGADAGAPLGEIGIAFSILVEFSSKLPIVKKARH